MSKTILVDPAKCTGCRICENACSMAKNQECNPAGSRIKVWREEGRGIFIPILCAHCTEPPCLFACPLDLISRDQAAGVVTARESVCIGCKACLISCPFGAVSFDEGRGVAVRCDQCQGDPMCVKFCPTGALQYVRTELADLPRRRQMAARLGESMAAARDF